jgi:hypothetical protein
MLFVFFLPHLIRKEHRHGDVLCSVKSRHAFDLQHFGDPETLGKEVGIL